MPVVSTDAATVDARIRPGERLYAHRARVRQAVPNSSHIRLTVDLAGALNARAVAALLPIDATVELSGDPDAVAAWQMMGGKSLAGAR